MFFLEARHLLHLIGVSLAKNDISEYANFLLHLKIVESEEE